MVNKSLVIALSMVALALVGTIATATYAANMMNPQHNDANHQMSEEQCESMMQNQNMSHEQCESIMSNMHNSEQHSSMMGDSNHDSMMGSNGMGMDGTDGMNHMGSGGCH